MVTCAESSCRVAASKCSEESREFLKRNPLDKFGSYRVWTRRECLWGRARIPVVGMAFIVNGQLFRGGLVFGRKNTFGTTSSLAGSPSGPPEAEEGRRGGSLVCRASERRGGAGPGI